MSLVIPGINTSLHECSDCVHDVGCWAVEIVVSNVFMISWGGVFCKIIWLVIFLFVLK